MARSVNEVDLAIGFTWEYDWNFVRDLEERVQKTYGLTTYRITEENVESVLAETRTGGFRAKTFLDRGFDVDDRFQSLGRSLENFGAAVVNCYDRTTMAIDKATMHLEFMTAGINVPFSITISPYEYAEEIELTLDDLAHLGRPFVIKPANTTGGSLGVVVGAETLLDVLETRKELSSDKYLLQELIEPRVIEGRRCWFRCYYVYEKIYLSWWDDKTHLYEPVTPEDEHYYHLRPLRTIMKKIGKVCGLNFFSSEIALRQATPYERSRFIVIDYVNDMCDMRSIDEAHDGLPNALRGGIVERLAFATNRTAKRRR